MSNESDLVGDDDIKFPNFMQGLSRALCVVSIYLNINGVAAPMVYFIVKITLVLCSVKHLEIYYYHML